MTNAILGAISALALKKQDNLGNPKEFTIPGDAARRRKRSRTKLVSGFAAILVACSVSLPAAANDFDSLAKTARTKLEAVLGNNPLVSAIFGRVDASIAIAINNAQNSANGTLFSAANTLASLEAKLKRDLDDSISKGITQLSDQRVLALYDLLLLSEKLKDGVGDSTALMEIGLARELNRLPSFLVSDMPFLVVRVSPSLIVQKVGQPTDVTIYGVGFGSDNGHERYKIQAKLGGVAIPNDKIGRLPHGVSISLDSAMLSGVLAPAGLGLARTQLELTSTIDRRCFLCGKKTYSTSVAVMVYPKGPGTFGVKQWKTETIRDMSRPDRLLRYIEVPSRNRTEGPTVGRPWEASPGYAWAGVELSPDDTRDIEDGGGAFAVQHSRCEISTDGQRAQCTAYNTGPSAAVAFRLTQVPLVQNAVEVPGTSGILISPGQDVEVDYDPTASRVTLQGTLPTGRAIQVPIFPATGSAFDPVICTGHQQVGSRSFVTCHLGML